MEEKHQGPEENEILKVAEPLETYFQSPGFLKSYKHITFSSPEEQEDANRIFSASLTPLQRLEYLYILNNTFLAEHIKRLPDRYTKIYFD